MYWIYYNIVSTIGIDTVSTDGIDTVRTDGINTVRDEAIDTVRDDAIDTVSIDGINTVRTDGINIVRTDGINTVCHHSRKEPFITSSVAGQTVGGNKNIFHLMCFMNQRHWCIHQHSVWCRLRTFWLQHIGGGTGGIGAIHRCPFFRRVCVCIVLVDHEISGCIQMSCTTAWGFQV